MCPSQSWQWSMFPWSETDISWELNSAQEIAMFLKDPFLQILSIKQTHATKSPSTAWAALWCLGFPAPVSARSLKLRNDPCRGERGHEQNVLLVEGKQRAQQCIPPCTGPALQSPVLPHGFNCHLPGSGWNWHSWSLKFSHPGDKIWEVNLSEKESFVKCSFNAKFTFLRAHGNLKINKLTVTIRQLNNTQRKMETGRMPRNRQLGDVNFVIHCILYYFFLITHATSVSLACHIPGSRMHQKALTERRRKSWQQDKVQVHCLVLRLWPVVSFSPQGH